LLITLGDRVRVVSAPLLSFVATGDLTINGTLDELKPKGLISLRSGQVNLFTTQFTLARGYPQTAEFVENQGLDPNLNVRLITSVAEVTSSRLPTSTLSSEINDSTLTASAYGSLQTVRVQAQVQGPASRLSDNLTLTSSPARSETEIVSLLGAGFVNTLGRGDTALGIANLAGSALLSNIQGVIGNALGLSEFRLFPTVTRPDRARGSSRGTSALGLGAEAAIDITPSFSLSALKVLTSNEPTQFGIRYRLNDQILLRGSSDFSGDSRALVEYEARF
jgi:translocation and assembly module TamB